MGSRVAAIEYHLPDGILSNEDLEHEFPEWSSEKIENKVGIRERRIAASGETALDLAEAAARKLLESQSQAAVDLVMLCTQSPDYFLPPSACILQDRLGLPTSVGAFDFNLGCSGYVYGLALAHGLISSGTASEILLVMAETYSKHIHPRDRGNRTVFGDAAAASLVTESEDDGIGRFVLGTDGSGFNRLIVTAGGMRSKCGTSDDGDADADQDGNSADCLFMDGPEIFNFTIATVPKLIQDTLHENQLSMDEIDYFVFHQANRYMLEHLRKRIRIPKEKFHLDMLRIGNTVSATIPIALADALEKGVIKSGSRVVVAGFGVGLSWGATILKI